MLWGEGCGDWCKNLLWIRASRGSGRTCGLTAWGEGCLSSAATVGSVLCSAKMELACLGCCWLVSHGCHCSGDGDTRCTLCALSQGVGAALTTKPLRYQCGSDDGLSLAGWGWKHVFSGKQYAPSSAPVGRSELWFSHRGGADLGGHVWMCLGSLSCSCA